MTASESVRRRWRAALLALAVVLGLAIAAIVGRCIHCRLDLKRAIAEFERDVGPLDPEAWAESPAVAELRDDNAAKWLVEGAEALTLGENELELLRALLEREPDAWSIEEVTAARAVVASEAAALETMARAVPLRLSRFPGLSWDLPREPDASVGSSSWDVPMSAFLFRQARASRVAAIAGELSVLGEDCDAALRFAELLARQATALGTEPSMIFAGMGTNVTQRLLELGRHMVTRCEDLGSLERLAVVIGATEQKRWPAARVLGAEAARTVQEHRSALRESDSNAMRWIGLDACWFETPTIDALRTLVLASRESWPATDRAVQEALARYDQPQHAALYILLPNLSVERFMVTDSAVRLARAAAAIRLEGLRTGAYPSAEALPELALEPTPFQGEVPVYERGPAGARLALPETEARWRADHTNADHRWLRAGPLEYQLPPIARRPGAAS